MRSILEKAGPCRFATLRNEHGIGPLELERQAQAYPTIFYIVETESGTQPAIGLHEGKLPTREDVLVLQQAGQNGVYLASLHKATAFTSQNIQRLLAEVAQIEATTRKGKILYRWRGEAAKLSECTQPDKKQKMKSMMAYADA